MSNAPLRVGVIGAGANTTSRHIPGLQAQDGVEIISVCNRSRESSQRVADQFGIPTIYEDWLQLIQAPDTDAIVVGTWPYMHCRTVLAALAAGKHVMVEARMAMNAREAHQMREASRARPHLVTQIVPSPFTLRVDATVKEMLAAGALGDLLAIELRAGDTFLDLDGPRHWRHDFELSGYNTMFLGIWYEALMRWVGTATRVMAMGRTFVTTRKNSDGQMQAVRIPEHVDVVADMACGAQAHFQISAVTGFAGGPAATLFGSQGTLRFGDNILSFGKREDKALAEVAIRPELEGGWRVEEEFVSAIRGQEEITHTSFEDGVLYMEFTEAVARSMATGCAVALPLWN